MPPLPDVPNVLKCVLSWTIDGDSMGKNIIHYAWSGGAPSAADLDSFASDLVASGSSWLKPHCGDTVGMDSAEVTDLTSPTGAQGSGGTPWVGTGGAELLAPGSAVLVNGTLARRYRGGKPRTYFPMGTAADVETTGLWKAASVTAFQNAARSFMSSNVGNTYGEATIGQPVNVSYYDGFTVVISPTTGRSRNKPTRRATPLVDAIVQFTVPLAIASQRRRNRDA